MRGFNASLSTLRTNSVHSSRQSRTVLMVAAARSRLAVTGAAGAPRTSRARPRQYVGGTSTASTPSTSSSGATARLSIDMQERMKFLQQDLTHLFDDQGIDESQYDDVVTFLDPITKYNNVQGYMFNIRMLKRVFEPVFELHDIRQTGEFEATTRWTMTMKFTPAEWLGLSRWWCPSITFTGTSAYGFNPANGRINRHVDTWDSIQQQRFFSMEAFGDFWAQLLAPYLTPPLQSPRYTLLRRARGYQVRRYDPFLTAEATMDGLPGAPFGISGSNSDDNRSSSSSSSSSGFVGPVNPAGPSKAAFRALANYIFAGNTAGRRMAMTTPVLSDTSGVMRFALPAEAGADQASAPQPADAAVRVVRDPGGLFAAAVFNGVATPRAAAAAAAELTTALEAAGLVPAEPGAWTLARYNDPSVPARLRRNEVLVRLSDFDLWV